MGIKTEGACRHKRTWQVGALVNQLSPRKRQPAMGLAWLKPHPVCAKKRQSQIRPIRQTHQPPGTYHHPPPLGVAHLTCSQSREQRAFDTHMHIHARTTALPVCQCQWRWRVGPSLRACLDQTSVLHSHLREGTRFCLRKLILGEDAIATQFRPLEDPGCEDGHPDGLLRRRCRRRRRRAGRSIRVDLDINLCRLPLLSFVEYVSGYDHLARHAEYKATTRLDQRTAEFGAGSPVAEYVRVGSVLNLRAARESKLVVLDRTVFKHGTPTISILGESRCDAQ